MAPVTFAQAPDAYTIGYYERLIRVYLRSEPPAWPQREDAWLQDWPGVPPERHQLLEALYRRLKGINGSVRPEDMAELHDGMTSCFGTPAWATEMATACGRWAPVSPGHKDYGLFERRLGTMTTPRCPYCLVFADREDAQAYADETSPEEGRRVFQTDEGHWAVERWASWPRSIMQFFVGTVSGILKLLGYILLFAVIGFGLSKCGFGDSNCHTEWDGRSNPTYCD